MRHSTTPNSSSDTLRAFGRTAMVNNLLTHLGTGSSAVVAGGPRMGKTTFLQQIAAAATQTFQPVLIDLATEPKPDLAQRIPTMGHPVILLIDNCERLLPDPLPFLAQMNQAAVQFGAQLAGTVWAGDPRWGEWAMANKPAFSGPIRYYPLIVLPPKEARPFLKRHWPEDVPASELEWVVELSGGHPYLLSRMVKGPERDFDAFFVELWNAAGLIDNRPAERTIIMQLIQAKSWVPLQEIKDAAGGSVPKTVLDRLAVTGLINRTLIDGAAVAAIVSPLLSDWARRTAK